MRQPGRLIALPAAVALFGCQGAGVEDRDGRETRIETGNIGSIRFAYDTRLLSPADVQLAIPPAATKNTFGVKLVPAREVADHDEHLCRDEGSDETRPCTLAEEPGLTLALLELPFASYVAKWRESKLKDAISESSIDGVRGLVADAGEEDGLQVRYILVPVDDRALLIKRQSDGETAEEMAAIAAVIASLDLPG